MRARGSLGSTEDADFGRVPCCCGITGWYLPLGCLFRRYMRHLHGASDDEEDEAAEEQRRKSSMTRAERRAAVEELLLEETRKSSSSSRRRLLLSMVRRKQKQQRKDDSEEGALDAANAAVGVEAPTEGQTNPSTMLEDVDLEAGVAADDDDDLSSCNGPMCSICLGDLNESNDDNTTMQVLTCPHQFHRDCILDWLQCRGKTECPCCRVEMVSEDDVRRVVKRTRKEQKRQAKKLGRSTTSVIDVNDDDISETEEYLGDDDGVDIEETTAPATVSNEQQESSEQ